MLRKPHHVSVSIGMPLTNSSDCCSVVSTLEEQADVTLSRGSHRCARGSWQMGSSSWLVGKEVLTVSCRPKLTGGYFDVRFPRRCRRRREGNVF